MDFKICCAFGSRPLDILRCDILSAELYFAAKMVRRDLAMDGLAEASIIPLTRMLRSIRDLKSISARQPQEHCLKRV